MGFLTRATEGHLRNNTLPINIFWNGWEQALSNEICEPSFLPFLLIASWYATRTNGTVYPPVNVKVSPRMFFGGIAFLELYERVY